MLYLDQHIKLMNTMELIHMTFKLFNMQIACNTMKFAKVLPLHDHSLENLNPERIDVHQP
ncbi:MAG: hypothetical protein ACD_6C00762G0001 [uncultured bacterium]|nr:MAG: hypothetical protein ACD_6C00762G0001 [uncultured bacterium]